MKWGFTKEIKTKTPKREDKIFVLIRYFWKKVHQLLAEPDMFEKFQNYIKNPENLKKFHYEYDKCNEQIKLALTNFDEKSVKNALEKYYQFFLKVYHELKKQ